MNKIHEPSAFRSRITDWPLEERPREKLIQLGAQAVSNAELIAILLGQGTPQLNAVELAKKLLRHFGSLEALSEASFKELQQIKGVGPAKAVNLLAAFQLYRNLQKEVAAKQAVFLTKPQEVFRLYQPLLGHLKQETFWVVFLDSALKRIGHMELTRGTVDQSLVHPREVFSAAIRHMAKGIIILHNHPSGRAVPSREDQAVTERIKKSGELLGIPLYDHLIITRNAFYSFKEEGRL